MRNKSFRAIDIVLSLMAIVLVISLFLKAILDMDTNYDVGWYHLPFAARIWGIIPAESFTSGDKIEFRYDGFPLLAHFFQGLFWKITRRVQAANLVGYFSVIIYLFFLKNHFKIPLYLSTIAIFTIPAVITHAPTGFVDLPGNIGASVLMMMAYSFFRQSKLPGKKELLFAFLGAATAANTKPQLQPLIFILFWVIGIRLIWLYIKHTQKIQRKLWQTIPLAIVASGLVFFTPIKNVAFYGNPFYPIKIEVAGFVLNHEMTPETYSEGNRPQKWLRSIFEINTPEWSADQSNRTNNKNYLDRAGGFFGAYVIFNLLLLIISVIQERKNKSMDTSRDATTGIIILLLVSLFTANFPQSHELRYLMFWMITLVSFNLYLVFSPHSQARQWFQKINLKYIYLAFFIVLCIKIEYFYLKPDFRSQATYLEKLVDANILRQFTPNKTNCAISRYEYDSSISIPIEHIFYYNSYFHSENSRSYNIFVAPDIQECGIHTNVIPSEAR